MGEADAEAEAEKRRHIKWNWKPLLVVLLSKEKQKIIEESIVAEEEPLLSLEPLIKNLDVDKRNSLYLRGTLPPRKRIKHLLKLIEANSHVHMNCSTEMFQLGEAFSGSTQLSTKVKLVTFLRDLQQTSKTKYPKNKFYLYPFFLFPRR